MTSDAPDAASTAPRRDGLAPAACAGGGACAGVDCACASGRVATAAAGVMAGVEAGIKDDLAQMHILSHLAATVDALESLDPDAVARLAALLSSARDRGALVVTCGNGGSAATAAHLAADLQSCGVRALALDSAPALLAAINDYGVAHAFTRPLSALLRAGDVLVALSCSGTSADIVRALADADTAGAEAAGLFGAQVPPQIAGRCDAVVVAPSEDYEVIEDVHLAVCHAVKKALKAGGA